jgi:hypothetical protein
LLHLRERQFLDFTATRSGAGNGAVVHDHELVVARQADIHLEAANTPPVALLAGRNRIFIELVPGPTMGDDANAVVIRSGQNAGKGQQHGENEGGEQT